MLSAREWVGDVEGGGDSRWRGKRSGEGGWWEGQMDVVGEFDGKGGDVVHPGTAGFAFEERGWVSGEK